jgi:hypothetical protein
MPPRIMGPGPEGAAACTVRRPHWNRPPDGPALAPARQAASARTVIASGQQPAFRGDDGSLSGAGTSSPRWLPP